MKTLKLTCVFCVFWSAFIETANDRWPINRRTLITKSILNCIFSPPSSCRNISTLSQTVFLTHVSWLFAVLEQRSGRTYWLHLCADATQIFVICPCLPPWWCQLRLQIATQFTVCHRALSLCTVSGILFVLRQWIFCPGLSCANATTKKSGKFSAL